MSWRTSRIAQNRAHTVPQRNFRNPPRFGSEPPTQQPPQQKINHKKAPRAKAPSTKTKNLKIKDACSTPCQALRSQAYQAIQTYSSYKLQHQVG